MNEKLQSFFDQCTQLKATIDAAQISGKSFDHHGWNQVCVSKDDLSLLLSKEHAIKSLSMRQSML